MAPQTQVRRIEVSVNTSGDGSLKALAKSFANTNKSIKETKSAVDSFKNAYFALKGLSIAGLGLGEISGFADSMQKLNDRLKLSEGSAEGAKRALSGLLTVANTTNSSIEDVATVYNRLNLSLRETGISSDALLGFTAALTNSFRLSGATAAEATAATIQLGQGLASGQLRGQELRSVLEQNALAGDILAKQFNTTRGALLKFAESNGGLDAVGVLAAFANEAENLNEQAAKLQPTLSEGLTTAFNNLKVRIGETNEQFGITQKLVSGIKILFENLGYITAASAAIYLWTKRLAIASSIATGFAATLAFIAKVATGVVIAFSPLYIGVTAVATAVAALSVGLIALAVDFDGTIKLAKSFLEWTGLITKQKSDVDKMSDSWYAATSAQNNYVTSAKVGGKVLESSLNPALGSFNKTLILTSANLAALPGPMQKFALSLKEQADLAKASTKLAFNFDKAMADLNQEFLKNGNVAKYNATLKEIKIQELNEKFKTGKVELADYNKQLKEIRFGKEKSNLNEFRDDLKGLNAEFANTRNLSKYALALNSAKLDKLNEDLKDGRTNVIDFNEALYTTNLEKLRIQLSAGEISLAKFRQASIGLGLQNLNNQFKAGKVDIYEYHQEVVALSRDFEPGSALFVGTQNYIKSAGTISQNIANGITSTFGHLEDYMVEFTKNGKFQFREFTKAILDDLNRIIIRALVIRPLAEGILGSIGRPGSPPPPSGTSAVNYQGAQNSNVAAKGAAFDSGRANFFAYGGVVNRPTMFKYGSGRTGVMGEAGPEAILPLKRGANGSLGVSGGGSKVEVNIINQNGSEVETRETRGQNGDRIIDVLILNKVKEGFAKGIFDKQMDSNYGLRRKGS